MRKAKLVRHGRKDETHSQVPKTVLNDVKCEKSTEESMGEETGVVR